MLRYKGGMIGSVTNITNGTAYTGRANGVFPLPQQIIAKSSSLWAIGQTIPNAPTIGTATAVNSTSISVAFIPPVQDGGSPITSYTVTSSPSSVTSTGTGSPIVVAGLIVGTNYTFTVTATNALGTSVSSGSSNSVNLTSITPDPYFSSVSILLKGDGSQGSTSLIDSSSFNYSPSVVGSNVYIDTSIKKYGTGSIRISGSTGSTNYVTYNPASANLPTVFTVEFWIYPTTASGTLVMGSNTTGANAWMVEIGEGNDGIPRFGISATSWDVVGPATTVNTWNHVAIVRNSSNLITIYTNGVGGTSVTKTNTFSGATTFDIGKRQGNYGGSGNLYYLDDFRVTPNVARYTANFTPPTAALPTS